MKSVAIVGMGTMGSAIAQVLRGHYDIVGLDQGDDLTKLKAADIIIIAVKPQSFDELSHDLKPYIGSQTILSIMAGISSQHIARQLGTDHVVRSMPNLGLAKAKSLTAAYPADSVDKQAIERLLLTWGKVIWLQQETDFDAFTALAGSGPAYLFEFVAQLQASAEKLGFDQAMAQQIANSTLESAGAMLDDVPAAAKVQQVASKGGTTEAALGVLARHRLGAIIFEAVQAAANRSKELSDDYR